MNKTSFNFSKVLSPEEILIWTGKQKRTNVSPLAKLLVFLLPIITILGLVYFVHYYSYFYIVIALPMAILEACLIEKVQREGFKEEYAISNKRLFVKRVKTLETHNIIEVKDITLTKTNEKIGTLTFEPVSLMESVLLMENSALKTNKTNEFSFHSIHDYVNVYGRVSKIRDDLRKSLIK